MIISDSQAEKFANDGFVHLKSAFEVSEIENLVENIEGLVRQKYGIQDVYEEKRYLKRDILSYPELEHLIFDKRIHEIFRKLLGEEIVYFGDSGLGMGPGNSKFHRDNVDRRWLFKPDWTREYKLARLGIYLKDHVRRSGGVKLRRRSSASDLVSLCKNQFLQTKAGAPMNMATTPGDLLLWDLRTLHCADFKRLKDDPDRYLSPEEEAQTDPDKFLEGSKDRMLIFIVFGIKGPCLDRYMKNRARFDFERWKKCRPMSDEVKARAAEAGFEIMPPHEEFGTEYAEDVLD